MNGHVKPQVVVADRTEPVQWRMIYQEPGAKGKPLCGTPLPKALTPKALDICGANHATATEARSCKHSKAWATALNLHGWQALQALQENLEALETEILE